jgi:hypothetical protein
VVSVTDLTVPVVESVAVAVAPVPPDMPGTMVSVGATV